MLEQGRGAMQVQASLAAFGDRKVLHDLGLQRGPKPLGLLDAVLLGCRFQFG